MKRKILGLAIMVVGLLLLFFDMGYIEGDFLTFLGTYWPISLVFLALYVLAKNPKLKLPSFFLALLGVYFQLKAFDNIGFIDKITFLPSMVIILGISIIAVKEDDRITSDQMFDLFSLLSTSTLKVASQNLKSGSLICLFGKGQLSLKESFIPKDSVATIDVINIFGSCDIIVPFRCKIKLYGIGNKPKVESELSEEGNLKVHYVSLFGRINILK